jgi:hypothetical protein
LEYCNETTNPVNQVWKSNKYAYFCYESISLK